MITLLKKNENSRILNFVKSPKIRNWREFKHAKISIFTVGLYPTQSSLIIPDGGATDCHIVYAIIRDSTCSQVECRLNAVSVLGRRLRRCANTEAALSNGSRRRDPCRRRERLLADRIGCPSRPGQSFV